MTEPTKNCPQPDAPELVMLADGYHYRTEDEMKELTNDDLVNLWLRRMNLHGGDLIPQLHDFARAAIAADRALNATADLEHQPAGTPVAWLLTDKKINDIQVDSVQRLIDRARQAHFTDLIIRINGKDEHYQADWLKHLVRAEVPVCAPTDREVMRQAPNGWKLVPIEPTLDQYNSACRAYSDWQVQCQEEAREHEDERNPSWGYSQPHFTHSDVYRAMLAAVPTPPAEQPIAMVLHCPKCGMQHIDAPESEPTTYTDGHETVWRNPAHRSHLCHGCGYIWRPADVPTNGVQALKTAGKNDSAPAEQQGEQEPVAWMTPGGDVTRSKLFADEQSALSFGQPQPTPLFTQPSPSLAELRAKVEALTTFTADHYTFDAETFKQKVLAEIDKLGGKV